MGKLEKQYCVELYPKQDDLGHDFGVYLASDVDQAMTQALGLAEILCEHYKYLEGQEEKWATTEALRNFKLVQQFKKEYGHE